jgi:hypothetical protein
MYSDKLLGSSADYAVLVASAAGGVITSGAEARTMPTAHVPEGHAVAPTMTERGRTGPARAVARSGGSTGGLPGALRHGA